MIIYIFEPIYTNYIVVQLKVTFLYLVLILATKLFILEGYFAETFILFRLARFKNYGTQYKPAMYTLTFHFQASQKCPKLVPLLEP